MNMDMGGVIHSGGVRVTATARMVWLQHRSEVDNLRVFTDHFEKVLVVEPFGCASLLEQGLDESVDIALGKAAVLRLGRTQHNIHCREDLAHL